jgi:hypothetical protein
VVVLVCGTLAGLVDGKRSFGGMKTGGSWSGVESREWGVSIMAIEENFFPDLTFFTSQIR